MQKELTYILGAGASYQSIPIVKTFPDRFNSFTGFLERVSADERKFTEEKRTAFRLAHDKANKILKAFKAHQSFDTYFKKLFHINAQEKITEAKKILNLYFIWEHLSKSTAEPRNYDESIFWKQSTIDKRYDALVAGLLKPLSGKSKSYCPINFITWNYDLNLFMSLKNYFSPNESFESFLKKINRGDNLWEIDSGISIINMNGFFYSSTISFLYDLESLEINKIGIDEILYEKFKGDYFSSSFIDNDAELIKFAWESLSELKSLALPCVKKAIEKISLSKNIVVIGYTFPLYNRLIDFRYFNGPKLKGKNLYIQDPNANNLSKSMISDFNIDTVTSMNTNINEETNCDSFLIPSSIYNYSDEDFIPSIFN